MNSPFHLGNREYWKKSARKEKTYINQFHLTDIYRTLRGAIAEYTFFLCAHDLVSINLKGMKCKVLSLTSIEILKVETIWSVFSGHSQIKLEINKKVIWKNS